MLKKVPLFWIVFFALLATSAIPLSVMAYSSITTTERSVEAEQSNQLKARVAANASTIEQKLKNFSSATVLAAAQAGELLKNRDKLTEEQIEKRLEKFERNADNVYGMDRWYETVFKPQFNTDRISDAFLSDHNELTPKLKYDIAITEDLDPLFGSILDSKLGTQWIYLTTADGMIRLYPWHGNAGYPVDWNPQDQSFYTVANEANNPTRQSVWTNPYNDFAGAGIMVTNAAPIYDGDKLIAVMSHDMLIKDLQSEILGFKISDRGFAFLIDNNGNIIAHKNYSIADTPLGEELSIKLADKEPAVAGVVDTMIKSDAGLTKYQDEQREDWLVAYSKIPSTNWHMGVMQPRSEIIAPALDIRSQLTPGIAGLIALVLAISVLLARGIALPIIQLSRTAKEIEQSVDEESRPAFSPANLEKNAGAREISTLASVFGEMVKTLQQRMNELNSIYLMGQTVTANVDFDVTMKAVLSAVRQVVKADAAEIILLKDDNTLVVEAWHGTEGFNNTVGRKFRVGEGLVGVVASTRAPSLIGTVQAPDLKSTLAESAGAVQKELFVRTTKLVINSFLGLPMMIGNRLIGVIALVSHEPGHFTEADQRQLNKLIAQASIAIDNAIKVRERESLLQKQINMLQIEIDEAKKSKQVAEITESEFFKHLQDKASLMRNRMKGAGKEPASAGTENPPSS